MNPSVHFGLFVAFVLLSMLAGVYVRNLEKLPADMRKSEYLHLAGWAIFVVFSIVAWLERPPSQHGQPSLYITIGAGFQLFGFCLLFVIPPRGLAVRIPQHLATQKSCGEFTLLMVFAFSLRLTSTLRFQGYLPTDQTGDGCYQILEGLTLLMALGGLIKSGITPGGVMVCGGVSLVCALLAQIVYGDLDNNVHADRAYATSIYTEVCAWCFLASVAAGKETRKRFNGAFVLPCLLQALCRANFWWLAFNATKPLRHDRLMDYFPAAVLTAALAVAALQTFIGILCVLESPLPTLDIETVTEIEKLIAASPPKECAGGVSLPYLDAKGSRGGFRPGAATFEGGVLKVEYVSV